MRRLATLAARIAVTAGIAGGVLAGLAGSAGAVSTAQFSLSPAPGAATIHAGQVITATATGHPVHRAVVVANRTGAPLQVTLFTEPATRLANGTYGFGGSTTSPGARVSVGAGHIELAPHASRLVGVTVDAAGSATERYAVIMATAGSVQEGSLSIVPRLAVLVAIHAATGSSLASPIPGLAWPWLLLAILLLTAAAVTAWRVWRTPARLRASTTR